MHDLQAMMNRRKLVVCLSSTKPNEAYEPFLHSLLPCKVIYSKGYENGVLFVMSLVTQTRVSTIENKINELDDMLKCKYETEESHFTKISGGLCRTFGKDEQQQDELCKVMFTDGVHCEKSMRYGVSMWTPEEPKEPCLISEIIRELDELNEPNPPYILGPGENAEVLFLQKEVAEANALTELAKRKLIEYESNGVEAGGGEVFDLKKKLASAHERIKTTEDERDAALKDADTNNWKLIEIQRSYANLSRYLREEQRKNGQLLLSNIKCKDGNGVMELIHSY